MECKRANVTPLLDRELVEEHTKTSNAVAIEDIVVKIKVRGLEVDIFADQQQLVCLSR